MSIDQLLVVDVNGQVLGAPCECVVEILLGSTVRTTTLPGASGAMGGVLMHRDDALPIIDMRTLLGHPTFEDELEELKGILKARERDHVVWLEELKHCCTTGDEFTKATDPHQCAFGRWFDGLAGSEQAMHAITGGDRELRFIIQQFDAPHRAIHAIAERALALGGAGDLEGAKAIIDNARNTDLATMRRLFKMLVEQVIEKHIVIYLAVSVDGIKMALSVDKALNLIPYDADAVHPVPFSIDVVSGICSTPEREVLVLNPAALRDLVGGASASA